MMKITQFTLSIVTLICFACSEQQATNKSVKPDSIDLSSVMNYDSLDKQAIQIDLQQDNLNKLSVSKSDSSIFLAANMKLDHRIFGYEKADVKSKRLLLFSIFTPDVEKNPYKCEFGAHYSTAGIENFSFKFVSKTKDFFEFTATEKSSGKITPFFIESFWTEFE